MTDCNIFLIPAIGLIRNCQLEFSCLQHRLQICFQKMCFVFHSAGLHQLFARLRGIEAQRNNLTPNIFIWSVDWYGNWSGIRSSRVKILVGPIENNHESGLQNLKFIFASSSVTRISNTLQSSTKALNILGVIKCLCNQRVPADRALSTPLLANIYLNTLDRLWEKCGFTHGILVRYADDTVIICKNKKSANHALNLLQYIMAKLDLKLHPVKTKIVSMWDGKEGFDFLGMHHRRMTTETRKGQLYKETYQYPSRKAMKKMKAEVKRNVNRRSLLVAKEEDLIKNLNPKITGWKNYYSTTRNEKWMQALDWYIICTFTRWYNKKHQRRNRMSKVGFVKNSIYGKGLKKMARA